ncbi:MAG: class I SAM-dependent methyltransferase [Actinobacteria bacterium]|nr:class I SAM-dependent methyltransferase [Actinomycetota bacterium]
MNDFSNGKPENRTTGATPNESVLYGDVWNSAHQGYFSDPEVAAPFVDALIDVFRQAKPDVVADLGGGTGVVLKMLLKRLGESAADHFVVDASVKQLDQVCDPGIRCVQSPVEKLEREMLVQGNGSLLLCMRSLLHYFGKDGLRPILKHFRTLLKVKECLVHQTVCYETEEEGLIANKLYKVMDTGKWFPALNELTEACEEEGFIVIDRERAPSLVLRKSELEERYAVDPNRMANIAGVLKDEYGELPGVFQFEGNDFTIYLHYFIMICEAV